MEHDGERRVREVRRQGVRARIPGRSTGEEHDEEFSLRELDTAVLHAVDEPRHVHELELLARFHRRRREGESPSQAVRDDHFAAEPDGFSAPVPWVQAGSSAAEPTPGGARTRQWVSAGAPDSAT